MKGLPLNNLSNLPTQDNIVSSENEKLILVNPQDQEIGSDTKEACHNGDGVLHRAFSVFVFNASGEVLLQQRSGDKRLWPLFWSNSCCSHPRVGETMEEATQRRLHQELGVRSDNLRYLYKFQYQANFGPEGSENELCSVYIGSSNDQVVANVNEVSDWRFIQASDLTQELSESPESFTPWFKLEWRQLTQDYADDLRALGVAL